ncbi:MAG: hypothetical protein K2F64_02570 [Muribaculaceae bacterium]|nr:hypothetical protein [Muribaculaceae bacterium]
MRKHIYIIIATLAALTAILPSTVSGKRPAGRVSHTAWQAMAERNKEMDTLPIECKLRDCFLDGKDAVVVFAITNTGKSEVGCCFGPVDLEQMHIVGENGQVFTNVECYVDSRKVSDADYSKFFEIKGGQSEFVSMVVHDMPSGVKSFEDIDVPVLFSGQAKRLFHFDNVRVMKR